MKLAEALAERSDLNRKLGSLRERIADSLYSSDDSPAAEDANELLAQAQAVAERISALAVAINRTNISTAFSLGGEIGTLTAALALRDKLAMQHKTLLGALEDTGRRRSWYREEARGKLTVDVPALREKADAIAREARMLDLAIQQANWATEVAD